VLWNFTEIIQFATCSSYLILKLELLLVAFLEIQTLNGAEQKLWSKFHSKLAEVICAYFDLPHYICANRSRIQIDELKVKMHSSKLMKEMLYTYTKEHERHVIASVNRDDPMLSNIQTYLRIPNYSQQRIREFWFTFKNRIKMP
jgi:hypothetical protein